MRKKIIRLTESELKKMVQKILIERNVYEEAWEENKKKFFDKLSQGEGEVDGDMVFVNVEEDPEYQDYPRYIYYKLGETFICDDGNSQQCKSLTPEEIGKIVYFYEKNK